MILLQRQEQAVMRKEKRDLEDYIDNLLVRVMDVQPLILQTMPQSSTSSRRTYAYGEGITCYAPTTPSYQPPAYTQPVKHTNGLPQPQQQHNRAWSPAKVSKGQQKKERRSSNPFKLLSSAFK